MSLYNQDGVKLKLNKDKMQYLDRGQCAKVYHNSSIIFKEYYHFTENNPRLKEDVFEIIKDINDPHFMDIYDIYSQKNHSELLLRGKSKSPFIVDAYVARYYPDDSVKVLRESTDYILDNFRELEMLFNVFNSNGIKTDDIKRANARLGVNGIVLIDPDAFSISKNGELVSRNNYNSLCSLLRTMLLDSWSTDEAAGKYTYGHVVKRVHELLDIDRNKSFSSEVGKKLQYVKKPVEYLIR